MKKLLSLLTIALIAFVIKVSHLSGTEIETTSIYTPFGVIVCIPETESYVVTSAMQDKGEYCMEFEKEII